MDALNVKDNIDALGATMRDQHDTVLKKIGTLSQQDGAADDVSTLKKSMEETEKMMKSLVASQMRPMTSGTKDVRKTYSGMKDFLRKGDETALVSKSMSSEDSEGGTLIPEQISSDIHHRLSELSFMRQLARVTSVSTDRFDSLVTAQNMDVGWTDEKSDRDETKAPELKKIRIQAHEMYARLRVTQKLIDDASVDIEQFVFEHVTQQMGAKENEAFLTGNGENCPKGLLHYATGNDFTVMKTGAAGAFAEQNPEHALFNTISALKTPYLDKAVWLMSRTAEAAIRKMKDPNQMHFLLQAPQGSEKRSYLLGYPVYVTDHMPALENEKGSISVLFGNVYEAYQIVDRHDVRMLRDPYSCKPFVEFHTTKRVGGDVINAEAMVALNFAA